MSAPYMILLQTRPAHLVALAPPPGPSVLCPALTLCPCTGASPSRHHVHSRLLTSGWSRKPTEPGTKRPCTSGPLDMHALSAFPCPIPGGGRPSAAAAQPSDSRALPSLASQARGCSPCACSHRRARLAAGRHTRAESGLGVGSCPRLARCELRGHGCLRAECVRLPDGVCVWS